MPSNVAILQKPLTFNVAGMLQGSFCWKKFSNVAEIKNVANAADVAVLQ